VVEIADRAGIADRGEEKKQEEERQEEDKDVEELRLF
jgi:hypothetical protein